MISLFMVVDEILTDILERVAIKALDPVGEHGASVARWEAAIADQSCECRSNRKRRAAHALALAFELIRAGHYKSQLQSQALREQIAATILEHFRLQLLKCRKRTAQLK